MFKRSTQFLLILTSVVATGAYANGSLQMFECDNHIIDLSSTKASVQKYCGAPDDVEQSIDTSESVNTNILNDSISGVKLNKNKNATVKAETYPIETWTYIKGNTTEIITFANGKVRSIDTELG